MKIYLQVIRYVSSLRVSVRKNMFLKMNKKNEGRCITVQFKLSETSSQFVWNLLSACDNLKLSWSHIQKMFFNN